MDIEEIRLSRALACAIESELARGTVLPLNILHKYKELFDYHQNQMALESQI